MNCNIFIQSSYLISVDTFLLSVLSVLANTEQTIIHATQNTSSLSPVETTETLVDHHHEASEKISPKDWLPKVLMYQAKNETQHQAIDDETLSEER